MPAFRMITAFVFVLLMLQPVSAQQTNWAEEYNRLNKLIRERFPQPTGNPSNLGPYFKWMDIKAKDRNEVKRLEGEVNRLSYQNPQDKELGKWAHKFFYLFLQAQESGISTVNGACMEFMYVTDSQFPKSHNWRTTIWRLQKFGRPIYTKAQETDFVSPMIIQRAKCMINFSIKNVECDPHGWSVYRGHESSFGYVDKEGYLVMWDRDFDVICERRGEFALTSAGEPDKPTDLSLNWIERIREECKWWKFEREYSDATDLMNEYYKDSMCKSPPNKAGQGHRAFYGKIAREHHLQKSIDYNEGFYGTLYGKVEIETSEGRIAAAGAIVEVTAPSDGETWTTEADSEGNYEIKEVLLHKACSPFIITAQSGKDKVVDQYLGPLENPDPSYRHEKNLLIRKSDLLCLISAKINWRDTSHYSDGSKKTETFGSATITITGAMRFKIKKSTSTAEWYEPEDFKVGYSYRNKHLVLKPQKGCPTLDWIVSGGGTAELPEVEGLNYMRRMIMGGAMGTSYELHLRSSQPKEVRGKKRKSYYCGDPCECQIYEKYVRNVSIGHFGLRASEGENGEMSGNRSWTSGFPLASNHVGFGINEFFGTAKYSPSKGSPTKEHEVSVQVSWDFKKLKN